MIPITKASHGSSPLWKTWALLFAARGTAIDETGVTSLRLLFAFFGDDEC